MKIIVIDAEGNPAKSGIQKELQRVEMDISDGSTISDIWMDAKRKIGLEPYVKPIINRQEVSDGQGGTIVVSGSHVLKEGDQFFLVFVGWRR